MKDEIMKKNFTSGHSWKTERTAGRKNGSGGGSETEETMNSSLFFALQLMTNRGGRDVGRQVRRHEGGRTIAGHYSIAIKLDLIHRLVARTNRRANDNICIGYNRSRVMHR